MEAEPMAADEIIEAGLSPSSFSGFETQRASHEQYRRDALMKSVSTSRGRTTPLYSSEGQPTIIRQRRLREICRRSKVQTSETYLVSDKRKRDDSYSTSPDLPKLSWDPSDEGLIVHDGSCFVKTFKTPYISGGDCLENTLVHGHISSQKPQGQQSHRFLGIGRTLDDPPSPSSQQTTIPSCGPSPTANQFLLCVETSMSVHEKGNILGNRLAMKGPEGHCRGQQPLGYMQLSDDITMQENDKKRSLPEAEPLSAELESDEVNDKERKFLAPKLEPGIGDEDALGSLLGLGRIDKEGQDGLIPTVAKRPRGRPRKHPLPVPGDVTNSLGKGRSKTGCITCRKRKKKCDEAKPGCLNCQKNALLCEGYQPLTTWRSGKQKGTSEGLEHNFLTPSACLELPPSLPADGHHASSRIQTLGIILPPIIQGIDTPTDKLFFAHYIHYLSDKLTIQEKEINAFRDEMIPMAVHHVGLMHSILSLSAASIHWDTPYGENLLRRVPGVTVRDLEDRGHYHQSAALEESRHDLSLELAARQKGSQPDPIIVKVRFGQLVCFVVKAMAEGNTEGAHRLHTKAYETYCVDTRAAPAEENSFMNFVREFFQYHMISDQLLIGPSNAYPALSGDEFWMSPETQMAPSYLSNYNDPHGPLFGLQHDIYMSLIRRIVGLRNEIRIRMERNEEPHVNYQALHKAAQIDTEIRNWTDPPEPPQPRAEELSSEKKMRERAEKIYSIGVLYKQMLWVYLFRTVYTPSATAPLGFLQLRASTRLHEKSEGDKNKVANDPRIMQAVDHGIKLLEAFDKNDPCQRVLLSPAFLIGCSSFEVNQRDAIRKVITKIMNYSTLRNADSALKLLEEVWRRMDGQGETGKRGGISYVPRNWKGETDGVRESSWDWEKIAREMRVDFLAA